MRIFIDADGCPVTYATLEIALKYDIEVFVVSNTAHIFDLDEYKNVSKITVDKGKDEADFIILKKVEKNDIVVTQDYGLASLCLAKNAKAINQNGFYYTDENIKGLLFKRYISQKERKTGKRTKIKKRTKENNEKFKQNLIKLIERSIG